MAQLSTSGEGDCGPCWWWSCSSRHATGPPHGPGAGAFSSSARWRHGAQRRDVAKVTLPAGGWRNTHPDICSLCLLLWLLVVLPWPW